MLQGLWHLIWIEIKVFFREPIGAFGTVIAPVLILVLFGRIGTAVVPGRRQPPVISSR